jgi:hypothetical protein
MASIMMMKNPQKLLNALASKPMTKWELKQTTGIEYPRVHEAISLLEKDGYAKSLDTILSKRGRDMKLYGLTFKGVIAYLSSISILEQHETENQPISETDEMGKVILEPSVIDPLRKGESIETYKERHKKEQEQYFKELEKIAVFLETYGKVLDYPLFKEIRWLKDKYEHHVFKSLIREAKIVNVLQPFPSGAMQLTKHTQKEVSELRNRKWWIVREPELQGKIETRIIEGDKIAEIDCVDPLADVNKRLAQAEERLGILREKENKWWSMGFAARFAEEFCAQEGKGDMHNETLRRFFEQVADHFRKLEVEPSEKMTKVFSGGE